MAASKAYDLLIVGGRVIDPGSKFDGIADVGVKNGKIAAVGANLPREDASEVFEAGGLLVTPGLVDTHVHV
jgi:dihydroorotase